jgi:acetyl esterase/lipase
MEAMAQVSSNLPPPGAWDTSSLVSWLFLASSLWGAWFTWNAYRPIHRNRHLSVLSFFAGWFTAELPLHHIVWQSAVTAIFLYLGALQHRAGWIGLAITIVSWCGLARLVAGAWSVGSIVDAALEEGLGGEYRGVITAERTAALVPGFDRRQMAFPFPIRRRGVVRVRNVRYARIGDVDVRLDVWHGEGRPSGCPVLLQIHGGAWILGSKNEQGLPLMQLLASRGWVCVSADYRLSPRATFPDHLVDLKRAIAWIREHIAEYGGDPELLVVTGGSAGGHLCSMVALTANDPEYQPGFEQVDTSVAACISFYGIYDFRDREQHWKHTGFRRLLERQVMKATVEAAPDAYDKASPIMRITPDAPPFVVIHGTNDTLVPVESARRFVAAFRAVAREPIVYVELPGAQHAFEIFPSFRTALVLGGVERFLAWLLSRREAALAVGEDAVAEAARAVAKQRESMVG